MCRPTGFGAPDRIRTCGLYLRRVALYPAELRVSVTWNYSPLITLVNDALTRLKPARVADHLMAFTCRRLRRSFRRGGCNVVATLPVNVDPKTSLSLTYSIHCENSPTKRNPALTLSPSEGSDLPVGKPQPDPSPSANAVLNAVLNARLVRHVQNKCLILLVPTRGFEPRTY